MSSVLTWPAAKLPQEIAPAEIHLWAWPLDGAPPDLEPLTALLDDDELQRFHRFHFERDRIHFAIAHAHLRRILGAYLGRPADRIRFRFNPYGKPEIVPQASSRDRPLCFNLSHSRSLAILALSFGTDVGVDVEDIRPIEPEVAESHFSRSELAELALLAGESWLQGFYHCWTRKEAILKAEGAGLNLPLDAFDVSLAPGGPAELLDSRPPLRFRRCWKLHALEPAAGAVGALAAGNARAAISSFQLPL